MLQERITHASPCNGGKRRAQPPRPALIFALIAMLAMVGVVAATAPASAAADGSGWRQGVGQHDRLGPGEQLAGTLRKRYPVAVFHERRPGSRVMTSADGIT